MDTLRAGLTLTGAWLVYRLLWSRPTYQASYQVETLAPLRYNPGTVDLSAITRGSVEQAIKGAPVTTPTVSPTKPRPVPVARWTTPAKGQPWESLFVAASEKYGLPAGLLSRVAYQESRYNPQAHNAKSNASGMMQIVPKWHPNVDPWNPEQAIPYAARYLAALKKQYGNWSKALAAYNWGPGNLATYALPYGSTWQDHLPGETAKYVRDITRDTGVT